MEENKKFLKDFYNEYNIDVYFLDEQKYMLNKEEEEKKVIEFLERKGSIDNYGNLQDFDDIIPYIDTPLGENINMPNEEQILFEQTGPFNLNKKVDIIKEETTENNNLAPANNVDINQEHNQNDATNTNRTPKPETNESKTNTKRDNTLLSKKEEIKSSREINKEASNEQKTEQNIQKIEEEKEITEKKEEEKEIIKEEKKEVLTEEQKIEMQLKNLQEREKKLLERKSEVLRRYLNENVMPILAKGILNVCENMPDDPVDALANFLLENSFNMQKGKIGEIEKIMDNE